MNFNLRLSFSVSIIAGAFIFSNSLFAIECLPVKGKVFNNHVGNLTQDAFFPFSTLGIAKLKVGNKTMKCGLVGKAIADPFGPGPHFEHTIVCDDDNDTDGTYAQLTFDTSFAEPPVFGACDFPGSDLWPYSISFKEHSVPTVTGPGSFGAFAGITEGTSLDIIGEVNCNLGIEMKLTGQMCFADNE